MAIHQGAHFFDNLRLVHDRAVRQTAKYLVTMSTYVDSPDGNIRLITRGVVYHPNIEKFIECYIDDVFYSGWYQADSDNAENVMSHTGFVMMYVGCPVLW